MSVLRHWGDGAHRTNNHKALWQYEDPADFPYRIASILVTHNWTFKLPVGNYQHTSHSLELVNYEDIMYENITTDIYRPSSFTMPYYCFSYYDDGFLDVIFVLKFISSDNLNNKRYEICSPIYRIYHDGSYILSPLNNT